MRLTSLNQLIREGQTLRGSWRLGKRHELQYRRRRDGGEEEVMLSGALFEAKPTGLVLRVLEQSQSGEIVHRLLTLRGRWQADAKNRLSFLVERERGLEDRLTFSGAWQLDGNNGLLYRFDRVDLRTKSHRTHTLTFRGHWDLDGARRLAYVLDQTSDSTFRFRGAFQTGSLAAKEGKIRYQLGVEAEGKKRLKTVTLFGKWKLSKDLSLELEVPYADGSARGIRFGAAYAFDHSSALIGRLTTQKGRPLGLELILTKEFLRGQGEAFVRLKRSLEEQAVEGGVRFKW